MSILTYKDFEKGRYKIPLNPDQQTGGIQDYITSAETKYLVMLFGVELYDLFIIDLGIPVVGEPTDPRFVKVFDPFNEQTETHLITSTGIKEMLKGFVYYLYTRDIITRMTTAGAEMAQGANSEAVTAIKHDITSRYNEAIDEFQTLQFYMTCVNPDDYPEFAGAHQDFNPPF